MDWSFGNGRQTSSARYDRRPEVVEVLPQLLIGEYPRPEDFHWLAHEHRISAIHSLQDDTDLRAKRLVLDELIQQARAAGLEFARTPIADSGADAVIVVLPLALETLDRLTARGKRVFLHCNAGFNRAPTVAIAFLHAFHAMSLAEALSHLKQRTPCGPYMGVLEEFFGGRGPGPRS